MKKWINFSKETQLCLWILIFFVFSSCSSNQKYRPGFYGPIAKLSVGKKCYLDSVTSKIRKKLKEEFSGGAMAGLAVYIQEGNETCFFEEYLGVTNVEDQISNEKNHKFRIGSITKSITASKVLELVENKILNLDDPIHKYFSKLSVPYQKITIKHLLSHTSGINGDFGYGDRSLSRPRTVDQILTSIFSKKLDFEPGSKWEYSNSGYYILGALIEKLSGRDYFSSLNSFSVFKKINVSLSAPELKVSHGELLVSPHVISSARKLEVANKPYINMKECSAVGAVALTAKEMTAFYSDLFSCHLFSCPLLKSALNFKEFEPKNKKNGRLGYGFGLAHYEYNGVKFFGHEGYTKEDASIALYSPKFDLLITVFTNTDKGDIYKIAEKIGKILIKENSKGSSS